MNGSFYTSLAFTLVHIKRFLSMTFMKRSVRVSLSLARGVRSDEEHVHTNLLSSFERDSFLAFQRHEPCG